MADPLLSHHLDLLLEHVDGPVPIILGDSPQRRSTNALVLRKLLLPIPYASPRPTHTTLSEAGRHIVAQRLARAAETLVKAGCLGDTAFNLSQSEIYRRIGASHTKPAKSPNRKTSQKPANSDSSIGRCNPEIDNSLRMTSSDDAPASCLAASVNR